MSDCSISWPRSASTRREFERLAITSPCGGWLETCRFGRIATADVAFDDGKQRLCAGRIYAGDTRRGVEQEGLAEQAGRFERLHRLESHDPFREFSFQDGLAQNHPQVAFLGDNRARRAVHLRRLAFEQKQQATADVEHQARDVMASIRLARIV